MAGTVISLAQKYGLPPFREDQDFDNWMHELDLWQDVTEQKKEKQASIVYLSLPVKARQGCSAITKAELQSADGMKILTDKLRELYAVDKDQAMFNAYEKFEEFRRSPGMSMSDYINEFEHLYTKLKSYNVDMQQKYLHIRC